MPRGHRDRERARAARHRARSPRRVPAAIVPSAVAARRTTPDRRRPRACERSHRPEGRAGARRRSDRAARAASRARTRPSGPGRPPRRTPHRARQAGLHAVSRSRPPTARYRGGIPGGTFSRDRGARRRAQQRPRAPSRHRDVRAPPRRAHRRVVRSAASGVPQRRRGQALPGAGGRRARAVDSGNDAWRFRRTWFRRPALAPEGDASWSERTLQPYSASRRWKNDR